MRSISKAKHINIFYTVISLFSLCLFSKYSLAQEEQFSVDYNIDYVVKEDGETNITHEAVITNLQNDVIPTTYTFSAKQLKIYDINAEANGEQATPKTEDKDKETFVSVVIGKNIIGEGRQNKINLSYKTKSIATKSGKIWNIYIPRIQIPDKSTMYNVKLTLPKSFGSKIYLSPTPVIEKTEGDNNTYYFTKESFKSTGIIAAFGDYQPVNFKLKYQIKNLSIFPSIEEIALPPDIEGSQTVSYKKIEPKPIKVKLDGDGNIIASYVLGPKKDLEIEAIGTARMYGKQINPDFGRNFESIPKDIVKKYTTSQKFWETESPYVVELASKLKDKSMNVTKNAEKIYDFISKNIKYDFKAIENGLVERKGAEAVLSQEGQWTCMEYTDLFIATARAMGIPAREINGYAFTFDDENTPISINLNGGDFLHSWAEFYDPFYGWVQIDPTWGATSGLDYFTKLDTNHFSFVVKGIDSEYPYPAGTYRFSDNEKLIEVALSQSTANEEFVPNLIFEKVFNYNLVKLLSKNIKVRAENIGMVSAYNVVGKTIPPGGNIFVYMEKGTEKISYEDMNGNKFEKAIEK